MSDEMMLITPDEYDNAMRAEYNRGWNDCTQMIASQQEARLSKKAQRTSRLAVARNADSIKGVQRDVLTALARNPLGLTDFDLEDALGRTHQSVSAARNVLMNAGLVTDSGKTRPNARGNRCIVWVVSSPSSEDSDVRIAGPVPVPPSPSNPALSAHLGHHSGARSVDCPYCRGQR